MSHAANQLVIVQKMQVFIGIEPTFLPFSHFNISESEIGKRTYYLFERLEVGNRE